MHRPPEEILLEAIEDHHDYIGPDPNDMDGEKWGPDPEALQALKDLVAQRDEARRDADGMARAPYGQFEAMRVERDELRSTLKAIEDTTDYRVIKLERALARAAFVAEHLLIAVQFEGVEWTGVIGPEGQSEDDYLNAKLGEEIRAWKALAETDG